MASPARAPTRWKRSATAPVLILLANSARVTPRFRPTYNSAPGTACDVPHLGFGFTADSGGLGSGGMDLKRELLLRIQYLDEQREAVAARAGPAQDFGRVLLHQPAQVLARERPVRNDADVTRTVADFPRFPDRQARRQRFVVKPLQLASAPDALLGDWLGGEGIAHPDWLRASTCGFPFGSP